MRVRVRVRARARVRVRVRVWGLGLSDHVDRSLTSMLGSFSLNGTCLASLGVSVEVSGVRFGASMAYVLVAMRVD